MSFDPITAVLKLGDTLIDKFVPDKTEAQKAKVELLRMAHDGELETMRGQIEINKIEAASDSLFKSGWRPAIGWVCVLALAFNYIGYPVWAWAAASYQLPVPPELDIADLLTLLLGMLGLGGMRMHEKINGVAAK